MGRRLARELALKILYRYEEGDTEMPDVIHTILAKRKYADEDKAYCKQLVADTVRHVGDIDKEIIKVLRNWPYDRIAVIDKIILRIGACEILYFKDVPPEVSINEAIEIGKKYGGGDSGRFINGILDAVKKNHESSDN